MIPQAHITEWRKYAPWTEAHQVEQDLVLTKALIQIYSDPLLKEAFAFRGGTAIQKLYFDTPTRYSEDIDLVQIRKEPIGPCIDALRKLLNPWLGEPKRELKKDRATFVYRFKSEIEPVIPMRLKIEINNGEHFTVLPLKHKKFSAVSSWFSGDAAILTYEIEELMGTKLRALYQRKKGRDLYDMAMALKHFEQLNSAKVISCFQKYMAHKEINVTRAQYEANLAEKLLDHTFTKDIFPLLSADAPAFDALAAGKQVQATFLSLLPGDPWKGHKNQKKKS